MATAAKKTAAKRTPQDRRPKEIQEKAAAKAAAEAPAPAKPIDMSVDREAVSVGLDIRPLPVEIGGRIWFTDPDPSPSAMNAVHAAVQGFSTKGVEDEAEKLKISQKAYEQLNAALTEILLDEEQKVEFPGKYGMLGVQNFALAWIQGISGFPTE